MTHHFRTATLKPVLGIFPSARCSNGISEKPVRTQPWDLQLEPRILESEGYLKVKIDGLPIPFKGRFVKGPKINQYSICRDCAESTFLVAVYKLKIS